MRRTLPCLALAAAVVAACAGNPRPGEPGYAYNLAGTYRTVFVLEGIPEHTGSVDIATGAGGVVSGSFSVSEPIVVVGSVEGTIVGDSLDFQMPYEQENGCAGIVHGSGAIAPGGAGLDGPVRIDDSCGGTLRGTIRLTR